MSRAEDRALVDAIVAFRLLQADKVGGPEAQAKREHQHLADWLCEIEAWSRLTATLLA